MFNVRSGILFDGDKPVAQRSSPNRGGVIKPTVLVMHYTGSSSAAGALNTLMDGKAANRVSAHLVIDRAGAITQLVPFDRAAWHAGRSKWDDRSGVNSFSIGIEVVNAGLLEKDAKGIYRERIGRKLAVPADQVVIAAHKDEPRVERAWQAYPAAQIGAAIAAAKAIVAAYGIAADDIVGHDDVAPKRKTDPGPAFPMAAFRASVFDRVTASSTPVQKPPVKAPAKPAAQPPTKPAAQPKTKTPARKPARKPAKRK